MVLKGGEKTERIEYFHAGIGLCFEVSHCVSGGVSDVGILVSK
jgi:hypothetical protein